MSVDPFDFDAFYASAHNVEPIPVRAFGEDLLVPAEMPALFELLVERAAIAKAAGADLVELDQLQGRAFDALFGPGALGRWLDAGHSWQQIGSLVVHVRRLQAERAGLGEGIAPEGASRPVE